MVCVRLYHITYCQLTLEQIKNDFVFVFVCCVNGAQDMTYESNIHKKYATK